MIVTLTGNIDDTSADMRELHRLLSPIHAIQGDKGWQLRCKSVRYLGPWAVATIAASFLWGQKHRQSTRITLPSAPVALARYTVYSGMVSMFKAGERPDPDHPECETIPLEQFFEASWDRSHRIIRLLNRHTTLSDERDEQLRICIQEVVQNIVDHAGSPIGGVMSARYMTNSREVRIAIVDRGHGIAASLSRQYADALDPTVALRRVIQGGFSSRSRPNNMGLGVSNLFNIVRNVSGSIAIFTENAMAETRHGSDPQVHQLDTRFPGTAVYFSLPLG